jgi:hypothetical protein
LYQTNNASQAIRAHNGRIVGHVDGSRFVKSVERKKHFYRRGNGWAADVATLDEAERAGASILSVQDKNTGTVYEVDIATLRERGWRFDHGHGEQVVLPLRYWTTPELQPSLL